MLEKSAPAWAFLFMVTRAAVRSDASDSHKLTVGRAAYQSGGPTLAD